MDVEDRPRSPGRGQGIVNGVFSSQATSQVDAMQKHDEDLGLQDEDPDEDPEGGEGGGADGESERESGSDEEPGSKLGEDRGEDQHQEGQGEARDDAEVRVIKKTMLTRAVKRGSTNNKSKVATKLGSSKDYPILVDDFAVKILESSLAIAPETNLA